MNQDRQNNVLIVGGDGEFGRFLRRDILPILDVTNVALIERDTPREEHGESSRSDQLYRAFAYHPVVQSSSKLRMIGCRELDGWIGLPGLMQRDVSIPASAAASSSSSISEIKCI